MTFFLKKTLFEIKLVCLFHGGNKYLISNKCSLLKHLNTKPQFCLLLLIV